MGAPESRRVNCVLCGTREGAELTQWRELELDVTGFRCKRCGQYKMKGDAIALFASYGPEQAGLIGGAIRHALIEGRDLGVITSAQIRSMLETAPHDPIEKMDRLLLALAKLKSHPGTAVKIQWDADKHLAFAGTVEEARYIGNALIDEGLVTQPDLVLTAGGWRRVRALRSESGLTPTAFVAMAFRAETTPAWSAIEEAVGSTGWTPVRVDQEVHDDRITDRIELGIRRAQFVISDATFARPSVYWEAGFARALGKPVFWTAQKGTELHFDTSAFHHIIWEKPDTILKELPPRILNRIGRGPRSAPK